MAPPLLIVLQRHPDPAGSPVSGRQGDLGKKDVISPSYRSFLSTPGSHLFSVSSEWATFLSLPLFPSWLSCFQCCKGTPSPNRRLGSPGTHRTLLQVKRCCHRPNSLGKKIPFRQSWPFITFVPSCLKTSKLGHRAHFYAAHGLLREPWQRPAGGGAAPR